MEINNDPLVNKSVGGKRVTGKARKGAPPRLDLQKSAEKIQELQAGVQKSILRSQVIIGGLENLKALSHKAVSDQEKRRILQEIIQVTLFEGEQVLRPMENTLEASILTSGMGEIETVIKGESENVRQQLDELGKTRISEENLRSIESSLEDPEALLTAIISQLKSGSESAHNITSSRALDLLR